MMSGEQCVRYRTVLYPSARFRLAEKSGTGAGLVALTVAAACCVLWVIT